MLARLGALSTDLRTPPHLPRVTVGAPLFRAVDTVSLPGSQPWVQPTEAQQGLAKVWFGGSHPRLLGAAVSAESAIDLNEPGLPVVALAGRSNVGKSSLLNAILEKKTRFNVSGTPGKTREVRRTSTRHPRIRLRADRRPSPRPQVQLFGIGPATAATGILADLPGYGYARVSRDRRAALHSLITDYCFPDGAANPLLHRVFLLIDSKCAVPRRHACPLAHRVFLARAGLAPPTSTSTLPT